MDRSIDKEGTVLEVHFWGEHRVNYDRVSCLDRPTYFLSAPRSHQGKINSGLSVNK